MKLLFNPNISGFSYSNLKGEPGNVLFNCQVVGLAGLLELLQMYSGVNVKVADSSERLVEYYHLLRKYVESHKDCVLAKSFEVDGLNTARQCLAWRDSLRAAGWNVDIRGISGRLDILAEIEKSFKLPGSADLLWAQIGAVRNGCAIPGDLEIVLPCKADLMMPAVVGLLTALEHRGVKVSVAPVAKQADGSNLQKVTRWLTGGSVAPELNADDDSLRVFSFESRDEALAYLTRLDAGVYDVWVNSDNKLMDNWVKVQGQPTSGSDVCRTLPQALQLLVIGLGLFDRPLNIKNLVEWLNAGVSPLPGSLRYRLSDAVVKNNGLFNEACEAVIRDCVAKDAKVADRVEKFLPRDTDVVTTQDMLDFVNDFANWCKQRANLVGENELLKIQLFQAAKDARMIAALLEGLDGETVSIELVQDWLRVVSGYMSYPQYEAQVGCRTVVNDASNIVVPADRVICCDLYGESVMKSSYEFLTNVEQAALQGCDGVRIWSSEAEAMFNQTMLLQLFTRTAQKLDLMVVKRIGASEVAKHPLMVRLEKVLSCVAQNKVVAMDTDFACVDNRMEAGADHVEIKHADLLKWKERQSYSGLDVLINNPFDYVFTNMAHIDPLGLASVNEVFNVKGTVAHAIIAEIFSDESKDLDDVIERQIKSCGSVLLLKENSLAVQTFRNEVKDVVGRLKDFVDANGLKVESCEEKCDVENLRGEMTVTGFMDMLLSDAEGNLHLVDFKWSRPKKYRELILQNKSIQLALYKAMLEESRQKCVKAVSYYVMPACELITVGDYKGDNVVKITPADDGDLVEKLMASYKYRREQISRGFVEMADGMDAESIQYCNDTGSENLYPLSFGKDGCKLGNKYSNNEIFKGKKSV